DGQLLLDHPRVDRVRDGDHEVGRRVYAQHLLADYLVEGGDLDHVAADNVRSVDPGRQHAQHRIQANAGERRQLDRQVIDGIDLVVGLEGRVVHDNVKLVTIVEKLNGILERRV